MIKYIPLILASLWRKPARTLLTVLSGVVAFFLLSVLSGVSTAFDSIVERMSDSRLRTMNRMSLRAGMPIAYRDQIEKLPGVRGVANITGFPAFYRDPKNFVSGGAVDMDRFFAVLPEIIVSDAVRAELQRVRSGAIVGVALAQKYGWKVGDRITLQSLGWIRRGGGKAWEFEILGIYRTADGDDTIATELYFNYDYLDESRVLGRGVVSQFLVQIDDPNAAAGVARAIDGSFVNSAKETRTVSEKQFMRANMRQVGDVKFLVYSVVGSVVFALLVLAGNTMAQSVGERTSEFAVLRTLGYGTSKLVGLVFSESAAICLLSAACGMTLGWAVFPQVFARIGFGDTTLPLQALAAGLLTAVLVAGLISMLPAWKLLRFNIVTALARVR